MASGFSYRPRRAKPHHKARLDAAQPAASQKKQLGPKRLHLLRELVPNTKLIAFIINPSSMNAPFQVNEMLAAAQSYFVGACTGKSPGFSPLRMRST
jgi:hypothetical protein